MTPAEQWKILLFVFIPPVLFIIVYHYYYVYKVLTAKCRFCGREVEDQWGEKIKFIYTPWRKPKFICLSCRVKKKLSSLKNTRR